LFISVRELELRVVRFQVEIPPGEIEYDTDLIQSSVLVAEGSAQLLSHSLEEIRIAGKLSVSIQATCDRCLEAVVFPLEKQFDLVYLPDDQARKGGEDEIDESGIEVGYYSGNGLELKDVLRETILLALPMQFVCSESCKGICPTCGGNRNQRDCGCQVAPSDDRWSKLRTFRAEIGPAN
jgi:uncharacterized protein